MVWRKLSKNKQIKYHRKWVKAIVKDETPATIKKHINRHAKEIYTKDPKRWSASMRNLVDIFDEMYQVKPSTSLKLERLHNKYRKNPRRYTPPPRLS
ncbi:MAG: hypothetical protein Q7R86_01135 [bacterium]|nr:hypothetical protein [bacterium]